MNVVYAVMEDHGIGPLEGGIVSLHKTFEGAKSRMELNASIAAQDEMELVPLVGLVGFEVRDSETGYMSYCAWVREIKLGE